MYPATIVWIATPLFIQTIVIFVLGYGVDRLLRLSYEDAAPVAMIGAPITLKWQLQRQQCSSDYLQVRPLQR